MIRIKQQTRIGIALNLILLILFLGFIAFVTVRYGPAATKLAREPDRFRDLLDSYGYKSVLVFVFFQVLQVVVAAIPGEFVQIAGGYLYGTFLGTLYLMIGVVIGSIIVFYVSRLLGYRLVRTFVPGKKLQQFDFMMHSQKSDIAMFLLFLIPGLPKDILTYIAGLTPVKPLKFFIIATTARLPALFVSCYIGTNLQERNYAVAIAISAAAVVLFAAGLLLKDRVIDRVQRLFQRANQR